MSTKITIIGLGEIGLSLAGAFKARGDEFTVTGNDLRKDVERRALENKRVDRIEHNLFSAVKGADAVLLAIPADRTKETLELIGRDLGPEVIVLDWCGNKSEAVHWAVQNMDHPENFLGVWSGISPDGFDKENIGMGEDHFKGASLFIAARPDSSEKAIGFASSLADLLGMDRSFTEPAELDGMIAAVYNLPFVCASALMECLSLRPGWNDTKRAAGKELSRMTSPLEKDADRSERTSVLLNNRENTVRILDDYMSALKIYRDAVQSRDEALLDRLNGHGEETRRQWIAEVKKTGSPSEEKISASETMMQSIFGGLIRKRSRN